MFRWFHLLSLPLLVASAAARPSVVVDASMPPAAPHPLAFAAGGTSPDGHVLGVNDRYLLQDGKPWFPVMGEFHFARYPADEWETELLKMKAGGIQIVSTYVFWIFHEEHRGVFDWSGQRDLRRFLELCGKHGLKVWLRVGPWDHGEVRNGGIPDWVLADGPVRANEPRYLAAVTEFFDQIGRQVRGQFWKDGGPIIGVQLENEYHPLRDGAAHMDRLLEIAHAAGLDAPFYSATGWDKAVVPPKVFLPVFGGYTEQFWSDSRTELPPNQNFFFTPIRAEDNVGYLLQPKDQAYHDQYVRYPFFTAEMGGGMAIAYHRRPVMQAADSTAAALVKLGSGVTLLGYYMYQGGTNPDAGELMSESFTGWEAFNDLETKSYDTQAPLGEYGQVRETYRTTKELHLFLHDFGSLLAPMTAHFPDQTPRSLDDMITPRVGVRSDGTSAFVFINNYERNYALPPKAGFQVAVKLAGGTVSVPREPITLPTGVYTHWPINLPLGLATLRSATAQLLCRLDEPETFVFGATEGVPAEFVIAATDGSKVLADHARVAIVSGETVVSGIVPNRGPAFTVSGVNGRTVTVVVLSPADALDLWKEPLAGRERLLLSPAALWPVSGGIELESTDPRDLQVAAFPALESIDRGFKGLGQTGLFAEYGVEQPAHSPEFGNLRLVKRPGAPRVVPIHPDPKRAVALEPSDADFAAAAVWQIDLPESIVTDGASALLRIKYVGDVARLYAGDRLLTDNFYRGTPFEFGLWRLTKAERKAGLTLKVLPLRRDAPIYLPANAWPPFDDHDTALSVSPPEIVSEYTATFETR